MQPHGNKLWFTMPSTRYSYISKIWLCLWTFLELWWVYGQLIPWWIAFQPSAFLGLSDFTLILKLRRKCSWFSEYFLCMDEIFTWTVFLSHSGQSQLFNPGVVLILSNGVWERELCCFWMKQYHATFGLKQLSVWQLRFYSEKHARLVSKPSLQYPWEWVNCNGSMCY